MNYRNNYGGGGQMPEWLLNKLKKRSMQNGGRYYNFGGEIEPTVSSDREVVETKRGLFNNSADLGDDKYIKNRTALGKLFTKADVKASFGGGGRFYNLGGNLDVGDPTDPKKNETRSNEKRHPQDVYGPFSGSLNSQHFTRVAEPGDPNTTGTRVLPTDRANVMTGMQMKEGAGAEFMNNEGMQDAVTAGAIQSYNKKSLLDGELSDSEFEAVMNSDFGKTYLQGATKQNIGDLYRKNYLTQVDKLFDNSPEEALSQVNRMAKTNKNFATKLEGKSDEEKLRITRDMMSDGLIGDFHGAILSKPEAMYNLTPYRMDARMPYQVPEDFNIHGYKNKDLIYIGRGLDRIGRSPEELDNLLYASMQEGVDLRDPDQADAWLSDYFGREGVNVAPAERGLDTGGYTDYLRGSIQEDVFGDAIRRGTSVVGGHVNEKGNVVPTPGYGSWQTGHSSSAQGFQAERDRLAQEQRNAEMPAKKEAIMQEMVQNDKTKYINDYFSKNGIDPANATERDILMAEKSFDRTQRSAGGRIYSLGGMLKTYNRGGKMYRF